MVVALELPRERAFMHLDTALTMVDVDAFSMYPYLPDEPRAWTLRPAAPGAPEGDFVVEETLDPFGIVADELGLAKVRLLRAPIDARGAQREQWDDGNNFLALSPGVVVGYERNTVDELLPRGRGDHRAAGRRQRARPGPRRPALHVLPRREGPGHA